MTRPAFRLFVASVTFAVPVVCALALPGCGEPGAGSVEIKADPKAVAGQMFPEAPGKAAGKSASTEVQAPNKKK